MAAKNGTSCELARPVSSKPHWQAPSYLSGLSQLPGVSPHGPFQPQPPGGRRKGELPKQQNGMPFHVFLPDVSVFLVERDLIRASQFDKMVVHFAYMLCCSGNGRT